jgi:hypothetical protein
VTAGEDVAALRDRRSAAGFSESALPASGLVVLAGQRIIDFTQAKSAPAVGKIFRRVGLPFGMEVPKLTG